MLESDDIHRSLCLRVAIGSGPTPNLVAFRALRCDKSFVDDFDMERGIVSTRVGLSYDLLRLSPCSGDLYTANCAGVSRNRNSLAPPIHQPTNHQTTTATTTHKHNTKQIYTLQELLKGHNHCSNRQVYLRRLHQIHVHMSVGSSKLFMSASLDLLELLKGHKVTKILFVSSVLCVSVCVIYINIYTFSRGASSLLAWLQFTSNVLLEWFDKSNSMLVYYLYFVYCYLLVFVCIIAIYTYIPYILTRRPKLFY